MTRKSLVVLFVFVLALSATAALAEGGSGIKEVYVADVGYVPMFTDGRLNAFDMTAPAGIYVFKDAFQAVDENGNLLWTEDGEIYYADRLNRYEVWGYLPGSETIDKVLTVTYSDIMQSLSSGSVLTESAYGYTVTFNPATSTFTLSAPAYNYSFSWELGL